MDKFLTTRRGMFIISAIALIGSLYAGIFGTNVNDVNNTVTTMYWIIQGIVVLIPVAGYFLVEEYFWTAQVNNQWTYALVLTLMAVITIVNINYINAPIF